jgi:hypothetical protein
MKRVWDGIVQFVVGDDIWIAISVVVLLGAAALLVQVGGDAWWLLALGVPIALWVSLARVRRAARRDGSAT